MSEPIIDTLLEVGSVYRTEAEARAMYKEALIPIAEALNTAYQTISYIQDKAPGYDWNADPLFLTLKTGEAFKKIDAALAATRGAPAMSEPDGKEVI